MTTIPQSFAKLPGVSLRHRGKHTLELSEEVLLAIDFETFCRDLHVHDFLARSGEVVRYTTVYRDWETDRKSTRLNSSHSAKSRMPSSA